MKKFRDRLVPRFIRLTKPYWFSREKWLARGLLAFLVVLMLSNTGLLVLLNQQTGEFSSALAARDPDRYWKSIYNTIGIVIFAVPVYGLYYYIRDKLTIHWRRWMTGQFLKSYFTNKAFYKLQIQRTDIDNPDQRISQDVDTFTGKAIYFLLIFIEAGLQLIAFCGVLWSISTTLVMVLVLYAALGTLATALIFGRRLVGINYTQLRREADLRFSLVRVRENAESIAFYRGEDQESDVIMRRFDEAFRNYKRLIKWQFGLNIFQYAFTTAALVIPGVILARSVMAGDIEVGRVVQATGAFAAIFKALNTVVEKFDALSLFGAGIGRLDRFRRSLDAAGKPPADDLHHIQTSEGPLIEVKNVTLQTPDANRTLIKELSLSLGEGNSLLIVGSSGGGKSSLLRALAGLWDTGDGEMVRPGLDDMLFLPQRPYMIIGSLRAQLLYPRTSAKDVSDESIHEALEAVNLPHLIDRSGGLDAEEDWGRILSLGEQQRVAFARALLTDRPYVILDEATSALDEENEAELYELLAESKARMISVSHRPHLARYHSHVLVLGSDENWEVVSSADYVEGMKKAGRSLAALPDGRVRKPRDSSKSGDRSVTP